MTNRGERGFTIGGHPEGEAHVRDDLRRIVDALRHELDPAGVLLGGSYGRGEGRIREVADGVRAVNDYDLWVVTDGSPAARKRAEALSGELARRLEIDFVDIALIEPGELARLPPTRATYDLRAGGRVLYGPDSLLDRIPRYRVADLPAWERVVLLGNRSAGLLTTLLKVDLDTEPVLDRSYDTTQVLHLMEAGADALLLADGRYKVRVRDRIERLDAMGRPAGLEATDITLFRRGYEGRLSGESPVFDPPTVHALIDAVERLLPIIVPASPGSDLSLVARLEEVAFRRSGHGLTTVGRLRSMLGRWLGSTPTRPELRVAPILMLLCEPHAHISPGRLEAACRTAGVEPSGSSTYRVRWTEAARAVFEHWDRCCH